MPGKAVAVEPMMLSHATAVCYSKGFRLLEQNPMKELLEDGTCKKQVLEQDSFWIGQPIVSVCWKIIDFLTWSRWERHNDRDPFLLVGTQKNLKNP